MYDRQWPSWLTSRTGQTEPEDASNPFGFRQFAPIMFGHLRDSVSDGQFGNPDDRFGMLRQTVLPLREIGMYKADPESITPQQKRQMLASMLMLPLGFISAGFSGRNKQS